jgi:hypothetical protein
MAETLTFTTYCALYTVVPIYTYNTHLGSPSLCLYIVNILRAVLAVAPPATPTSTLDYYTSGINRAVPISTTEHWALVALLSLVCGTSSDSNSSDTTNRNSSYLRSSSITEEHESHAAEQAQYPEVQQSDVQQLEVDVEVALVATAVLHEVCAKERLLRAVIQAR